jgi:Melibiase
VRRAGLLALLFCLALPAAAAAETHRNGSVYAEVTPVSVVLGNSLAERRWDRGRFRTAELKDLRGAGRTWSRDRRDFALTLVGDTEVSSELFQVTAARVAPLPRGGLRVAMELAGPGGLGATRVAEAYPGVAGFRTQTTLRSAAPLALAGATLDEAAPGAATPTIHAFRAGADWREPDWPGPQVKVGDAHPGTWRDSRSAGRGQPLRGPAQWVSLADGADSVFMVMERNDFPSSRAEYRDGSAALRVDYTRDLVSLGPFEEQAHAENPVDAPAGRQRLVRPGAPLALEPAFVGFARGDGDEAWQVHKYLVGHRLEPYEHAVTFNSNGTDANRISTGAKDDMDMATVREVAPIARRLGVETFILDDGWQAASGDWEPDSPAHPEPRGKYPPRFPDDRFEAVREAIAPMRLGLWMSPMSFNPASEAFKRHPEWACAPVGHGTAAANAAQPEDGSNEAGIGLWSPAAIPHIEARLREAIEDWGVSYFKFDFLVWLDCAGHGDLYDYREAFMAMVDRLAADHPHVTFQIDETNDYRLFPFESVARGPSWFQNGSPGPERLLHNIWNLSPYVPAFSLGQHALGGRAYEEHPVSELMAVALLSHVTFFSDLRGLPDWVIDEARPWLDFYKRNRDLLDGVVYPLLDDPEMKGWTALQAWDPDRSEGALLAFRQDSEEGARTIALREIPPGRTFQLVRAPDEQPVATLTSEQLSSGIEVRLPSKRTAEVLLIR